MTSSTLRCGGMPLQLALLAKAVLVALLGADLLVPGRHGQSGLLFMFAAIVTSLLCVFAEMYTGCALISGMQPRADALVCRLTCYTRGYHVTGVCAASS